MNDEQAKELAKELGWGWREEGGVIQKKVKVELFELYEMTVPASEFVDRLMKIVAVPTLEAKVTMDTENGTYGDRDRDIVVVEGWQKATPEDIQGQLDYLAERRQEEQAWKQRQIDLLRKSNPELFKDES